MDDDIFQPRISAQGWPHLRDLGMADEEEEYLTVHVVIGVDYFFKMLGSTIVRAGDDDPVAVETCLGWVICGPQTASQLPTSTVGADKSADTEWDQLLRKFWELEAIGLYIDRSHRSQYLPKKNNLCLAWNEGISSGTSPDRDVCKFLWSEPGENEPSKTYRLTRVCFGLTCSPYLAMQTIRWHAETYQVECSGALSDLFPDMYVDELVGSCDSVADASRIAKEATELLGKGGFHLAKWASNSLAAVDDIPAKDQEQSDRSRLLTTLGVFWQRESDMLTFRPPERVAEFTDTKRGVLKALTSVFDPLGCLAPYTVKAKIIIQLLWQWRIWKEESLNFKTASQSRLLSTCEGFQRDDHQISKVSDLGRAGQIIVMDHGPSGGSVGNGRHQT
ncbi:hypothetical protein T4E_11982 [Trichinella pseudospiralis]|uniref:Peptidase aspartic putative domain-containing protein n=1 Tax=Trichinella pseudospiralis TaxID=6337 RepID=A0A0V0XDS0_TRIPS|nr:hypothetical protein T4E_11982 [Trichinella pseudospiralis]